MSRIAAALVAVMLLGAGCGYRPPGSGDVAPRIQRVHVGAFANDTYRPGLNGLVAASILRRLQVERRLTVVAEPAAEAVLHGAVRNYENEAIAFQSRDIGQRFRVRLFVTVRVTGRDGGALLTQDAVGEAFYTAAAAVTGTRAAEEDAVRRAAQDLAERLVGLLADEL